MPKHRSRKKKSLFKDIGLFTGLPLASAATGAGIGALIGTFAFPVLGTIAGTWIGAAIGGASGSTLSGWQGLIRNRLFGGNSPRLERLFSGSLAILGSAGVGALLGTFVFPGIGTLLGAAIGAGIGTLSSLILGTFGWAKSKRRSKASVEALQPSQAPKPSLESDPQEPSLLPVENYLNLPVLSIPNEFAEKKEEEKQALSLDNQSNPIVLPLPATLSPLPEAILAIESPLDLALVTPIQSDPNPASNVINLPNPVVHLPLAEAASPQPLNSPSSKKFNPLELANAASNKLLVAGTLKRALEDTGRAAKAMMIPNLLTGTPVIRAPYSAMDNNMGFMKTAAQFAFKRIEDAPPSSSLVSTLLSEAGKATIKGATSHVLNAPLGFLSSGKKVAIDPWLIQPRKEAYQNGVSATRRAVEGVLSELEGINGMLLKISQQIGADVEIILREGVAEGLENVGHTRAVIEGGVGSVTSYLAQKNLNDWLSYLAQACTKAPQQKMPAIGSRLQTLLTASSQTYKMSTVWNLMTFIQEAPPLFDSLQNLVRFFRHPEAAQNDYLSQEIERIKALIPKSEPWPDNDFPTRLALYKALTASSDPSSLTNVMKTAAWSSFYEKALSAVDFIINKAGKGLGGALAGMKFKEVYSLDELVEAGTLSGFMGIEAELKKCLVDTTSYYSLNALMEIAGGYIATHVIKGIAHKMLLNKKEHFMNKTDSFINTMLRDKILFNPDELIMVRSFLPPINSKPVSSQLNVNVSENIIVRVPSTTEEAVLALKTLMNQEVLPHPDSVKLLQRVIMAADPTSAQKAISKIPVIIGACQLLFVAFQSKKKVPLLEMPGKAIEAVAASCPKLAATASVVGAGYIVEPKVSSLLATAGGVVSNVAFKAMNEAEEHPYLASAATVGIVAASAAYWYAPSFRKGVNSYILNPVGNVANYILRSPALIASAGVAISMVMDEPLLAVSFVVPSLSTIIRTGGSGLKTAGSDCVQAARNINGFFQSKIQNPKKDEVVLDVDFEFRQQIG